MRKVKLFGKTALTILMVLCIGIVSAAILEYYGQIQTTVDVKQAVLLDGKDISQMPIVESATVVGGEILYGCHSLQSQTSVPVTVQFETTYSPELADNEIVTEILEIFDEAYPANYTPPTTWDIKVPGDYDTISAAIAAATGGEVIAVEAGTYNEELTINKGITLASLDGPASTVITGGIHITANNVKVTGFTINPRTIMGEMSCIYLAPCLSNIEISFNDLNRGSVTLARGVILGVSSGVAEYTNVRIEHNKIHDLTTGIYVNPHDGVVEINHNEIYNCEAGIGGATRAKIEYNTFHDNFNSWSGWYEAIGADDTAEELTIQYNNFLGDDAVAMYGAEAISALNNWWDCDGIDVHGNVEASYMIKTDFTLQPYETDRFCIRHTFAVDIYPDTYTITTTVKPCTD